MTINKTIFQTQGSYRTKEGRKEGRKKGRNERRKEGQKYKRVFLKVGIEMYMPLDLHCFEFPTQMFCVILLTQYNLLPLNSHHIRNTLFCTTDITKNHTHALSTVCTYRVLLLLIVFVLQSAICSSIHIKQEQTPNARQSQHSSMVLFLSFQANPRHSVSKCRILEI